MKIVNAIIPKTFPPQNDIESIEMSQQGQLVLIAGRNGSGKSRLLSKIAEAFNGQPRPQRIDAIHDHIKQNKEALYQYQIQIKQWNNQDFNPTVKGEERERLTKQAISSLNNIEAAITSLEAELGRTVLQFDQDSDTRQIVYFVPKKLDLVDPQQLNEIDRENRARATESLGVERLNENGLCKIQEIHTKYWHATHQNSQLSAEERDAICAEYERMQVSIEELLGVRICNNSRGNATIFGHPIGQANLSDGQKVLLQLAIAIHCQGNQLSDTILLLDEPENHIHPAAIIEVLETILAKIPDGQVWVATHSVSLLAHFAEIGSLWYMDDGKVSPAGKIQEKVLHSLLGDENRLVRQRDFLEKPEKVALVRYAQQCLCQPYAIMTGAGDPQVSQIQKAIADLYKKYGKLKLLDFGAGQGRLLVNLGEDVFAPGDIPNILDYVAYDNHPADEVKCRSTIRKVYTSCEERWFCRYNDLISGRHNKGSFNLIVMCNVLHEIVPTRWEELFGPSGEITELLAEDGKLLIVEDHRIPVGEYAHEYGFIVLDTGALKDLLAVKGGDPPILAESERNGRLKSHLISREQIGKVTKGTIKKALGSHIGHARNEIQRLRESGGDSDGRVFAFWLVQFANTVMSMELYGD